jgi:hypothetical protein
MFAKQSYNNKRRGRSVVLVQPVVMVHGAGHVMQT